MTSTMCLGVGVKGETVPLLRRWIQSLSPGQFVLQILSRGSFSRTFPDADGVPAPTQIREVRGEKTLGYSEVAHQTTGWTVAMLTESGRGAGERFSFGHTDMGSVSGLPGKRPSSSHYPAPESGRKAEQRGSGRAGTRCWLKLGNSRGGPTGRWTSDTDLCAVCRPLTTAGAGASRGPTLCLTAAAPDLDRCLAHCSCPINVCVS